MILTLSWLKKHLKTPANLNKIIDKLTNIGLEVENIKNVNNTSEFFKIAKVVKVEKHPNADKLKICDVLVSKDEIKKVVCGADNVRPDLYTVHASPGAVIPKSKLKLKIAKIRGVESFGMLCSESELNISNESTGIIDLKKNSNDVGKSFFRDKHEKIVEISVTPNRPDCLGIRGIARDLSAAGLGSLIDIKKISFKQKKPQNIKVSISKERGQGCLSFGSCLIKNIKNTESPKWLKDKIISLGLKPISAIVDITNYVMFDLNRPLHAYDADKIDKEIIVRNSRKNETFDALDEKKYNLEGGMCVITDRSGVLGLGGVIGGKRSGTELETKNIFLESAYFLPSSVRKTSKALNIDTDAKFRFERGIDPNSIEEGLKVATDLILNICGGEASKFQITGKKNFNKKKIELSLNKFKKTIGFSITANETKKILLALGFKIKTKKSSLTLEIPSWRPDINQEIDIIEELIRIKGFDKIETIAPNKIRERETLTFPQRLFHLSQRAISNQGYLEAITWSFTDKKIDTLFNPGEKPLTILNPISTDLDVLRRSIFSNLIYYLKKNQDRGYQDISIFEIGPTFYGKNPGEQEIVIGGLRSGKFNKKSWSEKTRGVDVFDVKADVLQCLKELGLNEKQFNVNADAKNYYHPGRSGSVVKENKTLAFFGEIHPTIISKIDLKEKNIYGFEIFLNNIPLQEKKLRLLKGNFKVSDFQKSERDFAFILNKDYKVGNLKNLIKEVNPSVIKFVNIFDVFEGENLPDGKKSVAINVTIQSDKKTLSDNDLNQICESIIKIVQQKTGGSIRS